MKVKSKLADIDFHMRDRLIAPGCSSGVAEGADGFLYFLSHGASELLSRISR